MNSRVNGYSLDEVAGMFEVDTRTIRRRIELYRKSSGREGLGPVFRDGKIVRVPESSICDWMQRNTGY